MKTKTLMGVASGVAMVLFLVSGATHSSQAQTHATLVITATEQYRNGFEELLAKEIYRRLGIDIIINRVPAERALRNVDAGIDDGVLSRVGGMARKYPNLVQFEESTMDRDFVAFSRRTDIRISGWDSLKPYNVGIITGWKILEWNIKGTKSLTKVMGAKQLFLLLDAERVDLVVYTRWAGLQAVKDLGLKGVRVLESPLATREMFFHLHKKHKDLIPRATAVLRKMKQDGTYQRIFDRTIGKLISK